MVNKKNMSNYMYKTKNLQNYKKHVTLFIKIISNIFLLTEDLFT